MKKCTSNCILNSIPILMSFLALIACLIIMLCVHEKLEFDEINLLMSVLSLLVTVLVGMQIWNIFQFEKKFEKIRLENKKDIIKKTQETEERIMIELTKAQNDAIGTVLMQFGWSFIDKKEYDDALRTFINSLRALQQGNWQNDHDLGDYYKDVVDYLLSLSKELPPENWYFVNIDEKNVFIDTIMKIPNKEKMNQLLDFFYKFRIAE